MTSKKTILILIALFCLLIPNEGQAQRRDTLQLRVMTYNLRFGELASLEDIAAHIRSFKPDFVALEEVDVKTYRERAPKQNGKDFISTLAYHTGMFGLYGKTIDYRKGYYGIGILSKYPYMSVDKNMLPNPSGKEPRALLEGLFDVDGDTIVFAVTHLDVTSKEGRVAQAKYITNHFKGSQYPVVIGGDFNAHFTEPAIKKEMRNYWKDLTNEDLSYPSWQPETKIDYLFAQPAANWQVVKTQTVQSMLSDHYPVVSVVKYIRNKKK